MKKFCIILIVQLMASDVSAQSCLPEGIYFNTQAQIDSFQINYPNCTEIEGNVYISGYNNITNLNGLSVLTSIGDSLWIGWQDALTNLTGLNNLTSIGGSLDIIANSLSSLTGLGSLTSIGGHILITNNDNLYDLTGLESLDSICGWFKVYQNDNLTSLTGLDNLISIGGYLHIENNPALTSLIGLENIDAGSITDLYISDNSSLSNCGVESICNYLASPNGIVNVFNNATGCNSVVELANTCGGNMPCLPYGNYGYYAQVDIDGFQSAFPNCTDLEGSVIIRGSDINDLSGLNVVTSIRGWLWIDENSILSNLTGLDNVSYIGGQLHIYYNDALASLTGLNSLTSIGNTLDLHFNDALNSLTGLDNLTSVGNGFIIYGNSVLTSITALNALNSIGGYIWISYNDSLNSLTGIDNIDAGTISNIDIWYNSSLSTCDVQSICDYLANPNGTVDILDNSTGCNSVDEVEAACGVGMNDNTTPDPHITMYPNPSSTIITISTPTTPNKNTFITIYNINDQQLIERQITEQQTVVDVSGLSQGVYFVRMSNERTVMVGKFVKR